MESINYKNRLDHLMTKLEGGAMLLMSQPVATKNSDVHHSYRQESFLYYLTGIRETDSALLVLPHGDKAQKTVLFVHPKDPLKEMWEGVRLGVEGAKGVVPVDEVREIGTLWSSVRELMGLHDKIYYHLGVDAEADRNLISAIEYTRRGKPRRGFMPSICDPRDVSGQMRLCKDEAEVDRMQKACDITKKAFDVVYASVKPGMNERAVYGTILGEFYKEGAEMEAYGTIVAGGKNACILHYVENDQPLKDGDLLLIDAGAQYDYYAADVTRTFPIGKKFSKEQKEIYSLTLKANMEAIKFAKPGESLDSVHMTAVRIMVKGLIELKLLDGDVEEIIRTGAHRVYIPHGTSHWLGMDVHDVGGYDILVDGKWEPRPFEEGMAFTIEPGIYIPVDDEKAPIRYRGIGVRIEDDVVVTKDGVKVLTASIPKDIEFFENRQNY